MASIKYSERELSSNSRNSLLIFLFVTPLNTIHILLPALMAQMPSDLEALKKHIGMVLDRISKGARLSSTGAHAGGSQAAAVGSTSAKGSEGGGGGGAVGGKGRK